MTFLNPLGLAALITVPVIIYLHLQRERSKSVEVSDVRAWGFLEEELTGVSPRILPRSWLLLTDLAIACLLSLAVAQPRLNVPVAAPQARHVVILIDSSASMGATDVLPNRIEVAKGEATSIISSLGPKDVATVIRFGGGAVTIGDTRETSPQELISRIETLRAGDAASRLERAMMLGRVVSASDLPVDIHVLTDGALDRPEEVPDTVHLQLFGQNASNQAVLQVRGMSLSATKTQVFARFGNYGDEPARRLASLTVDGRVVDSTPIVLNSNSTVSEIWTVSGSPRLVQVELVGSDALSADDQAWEALDQIRPVSVALVSEQPEPVDRALRSVPGVELRVFDPGAYHPGMAHDLTVFHRSLPSELPTGDALVIDPRDVADWLSIGEASPLKEAVSRQDASTLAAVDFTGVRWGSVWRVLNAPVGFVPLLQAGDAPVIGVLERAGTTATIVLANLDDGNFTRHPSFPTFVAHVVDGVRASPVPADVKTGEAIPIPKAEEYPRVVVQPPGQEAITYLDDRPHSWEETLEPGIYSFELFDREGRSSSHIVTVHPDATQESDLRARQWAIEQAGSLPGETTEEATRELDLLPLLLVAAGILLLVEARLAWH